MHGVGQGRQERPRIQTRTLRRTNKIWNSTAALQGKARHGTARQGRAGQDHGENRKPRTMCPSCSSVLPAPVPRSTNLHEGVTHNPTNQRRTKQTNRPTRQVAVAACETVVSCVTCDLFHLLFDHNKPVSQQVSPVCMSKYALTDGLDFPYRLLLWSDSRPP